MIELVVAAVKTIVSMGSSIVSAVSAIAPAIARFAQPVVECFKTFIARFPDLDIDRIKAIIETTMEIVHAIVDILGLNKHKMDQDEIGERAMQNPEIKTEDYDTIEEYFDALHAAKYEKGKRPENLSKDAWTAMCRTVGTGLEVKAISEKMNMATPMTVFIDCGKAGLAAKDIIDGKGNGVLEKMSSSGIKDATELSHYLGAENCDAQMEVAMKGFVAPETGLSSAQMVENYAKAK